MTALPGEDGARAGAAAPPDESGPASAAGDVPMSGWLVKGLVLGIVQGLAVIPGISRSGSTIAAALFSGIPRHRAGEVSFLLSVPAILGATLLELRHLGELTHSISLPVMAAGFLAAMISGWLSLSLLVRIIRGSKLWVFCLYLVPLGIWGLVAL